MDKGEGLSSLYPSLKNKNISTLVEEMPCIIRHGIDDSTSLIKMLPMPHISEVEITNIINYIIVDMNGQSTSLTLPEVQNLLKQCEGYIEPQY